MVHELGYYSLYRKQPSCSSLQLSADMQSIFIGGLLSVYIIAILNCITGEHPPINKLGTLSRGVKWKLQVCADRKL